VARGMQAGSHVLRVGRSKQCRYGRTLNAAGMFVLLIRAELLNMAFLPCGQNPHPASPVHGGGGSRRLTEGVNYPRSLVINARISKFSGVESTHERPEQVA